VKKTKNGSVLLCIMLTMSIVLPYLVSLIRGSSFALDNALYHTQHIQRKYETEALLNYGISFCCNNFDKIQKDMSDNKSVMLKLGNWILPSKSKHKSIKGTIKITFIDGALHVLATLQNDNKQQTYQLMCTVCKNGTGYRVQDWNYAYTKTK